MCDMEPFSKIRSHILTTYVLSLSAVKIYDMYIHIYCICNHCAHENDSSTPPLEVRFFLRQALLEYLFAGMNFPTS